MGRKKVARRRRPARPPRVEVVKAANGYAVRVTTPGPNYSDERERILIANTPAELAAVLVDALGQA